MDALTGPSSSDTPQPPVLAPPSAGPHFNSQRPGCALPSGRARVQLGTCPPGRVLSQPLAAGAGVSPGVPELEDCEGATWVCTAALRTGRLRGGKGGAVIVPARGSGRWALGGLGRWARALPEAGAGRPLEMW